MPLSTYGHVHIPAKFLIALLVHVRIALIARTATEQQ